jgi:DNA polymerase III subunit epsilon
VTFVALDFETADPMRDSACALALVRVEGSRIVARETRLLRPPRREFWFTHIHGITWRMVEGEAPFGDAWPAMEPLLEGADFLAAHNAVFDRSVMRACCERAGLAAPPSPYLCTVKLARRVWSIHPTRLPDVCHRLDIPLRHHDAASDAEACARIVIRAMEDGPEVLEGMLPGVSGAGATASPPRARASRRR